MGKRVGEVVGLREGLREGSLLGALVGRREGSSVGSSEGKEVGSSEGGQEGRYVTGLFVVFIAVGFRDGTAVVSRLVGGDEGSGTGARKPAIRSGRVIEPHPLAGSQPTDLTGDVKARRRKKEEEMRAAPACAEKPAPAQHCALVAGLDPP